MVDGLSAAEGALLKGAQTVAQTREDLKGQLSTLRNEVQGVTSHWQGLGAAAFQALMASWDEEANKVTGALDGLETNLRDTQSAFDESESQAQTGMNKLLSQLGGVGN